MHDELSNNLELQMTQYEILHQTLESFVFIMKKEEVQKGPLSHIDKWRVEVEQNEDRFFHPNIGLPKFRNIYLIMHHSDALKGIHLEQYLRWICKKFIQKQLDGINHSYTVASWQ